MQRKGTTKQGQQKTKNNSYRRKKPWKGGANQRPVEEWYGRNLKNDFIQPIYLNKCFIKMTEQQNHHNGINSSGKTPLSTAK